MGIIVFATLCIIVFNLIVDLLYAFIDPRIRLDLMAPCSRCDGPRTHFRTDDGIVKAVDGVSFSVEQGQDARHRRRVRLAARASRA